MLKVCAYTVREHLIWKESEDSEASKERSEDQARNSVTIPNKPHKESGRACSKITRLWSYRVRTRRWPGLKGMVALSNEAVSCIVRAEDRSRHQDEP